MNAHEMYQSDGKGQSDNRQNRLARGCRADCSYKFNEQSDSREFVAPAQQFGVHIEASCDRDGHTRGVTQAV